MSNERVEARPPFREVARLPRGRHRALRVGLFEPDGAAPRVSARVWAVEGGEPVVPLRAGFDLTLDEADALVHALRKGRAALWERLDEIARDAAE